MAKRWEQTAAGPSMENLLIYFREQNASVCSRVVARQLLFPDWAKKPSFETQWFTGLDEELEDQVVNTATAVALKRQTSGGTKSSPARFARFKQRSSISTNVGRSARSRRRDAG